MQSEDSDNVDFTGVVSVAILHTCDKFQRSIREDFLSFQGGF